MLPDPDALSAHHEQLAELRNSLVYLYRSANRAERRIIVENAWPNRRVQGKKAVFEPHSWVVKGDFAGAFTEGAPERDAGRTLITLLNMLRSSKEAI